MAQIRADRRFRRIGQYEARESKLVGTHPAAHPNWGVQRGGQPVTGFDRSYETSLKRQPRAQPHVRQQREREPDRKVIIDRDRN